MEQCHAGLKPKCEQLVHIFFGNYMSIMCSKKDPFTNKSEQYLK
jgi:hypothetical protein